MYFSCEYILKLEFLIFFDDTRLRACALPLSYILSPSPLKDIDLFVCLCVFTYASTCMLLYIGEGQGATYSDQLSLSTMWFPGINLRSLVASALIICWDISLAQALDYVVQTGIKYVTHSPLPHNCWDYRCKHTIVLGFI